MPKKISTCDPDDVACLAKQAKIGKKKSMMKGAVMFILIPMVVATIVYTATYTGNANGVINYQALGFAPTEDVANLNGVFTNTSNGGFEITGMKFPAYGVTTFELLELNNNVDTDLSVIITVTGADADKITLYDENGNIIDTTTPTPIIVAVGTPYIVVCKVDLRTSGLTIGGAVAFTLNFVVTST